MWTSTFFIIANFLFIINCESVCKTPNTGSVLFRKIDLHRRYCWTQEELGMVYARRAMMDLIPKQIPHNIPLILEYIQICITTLKEVATTPKVYEAMFAALADMFGGYLQSYGLPLLHESYYEGYVSFDTALEFHHLLDDLKTVLLTNGGGWSKGMKVVKHINRVLPLKLPIGIGDNPCSMLMFADNSSQSHFSTTSFNDHEKSLIIPLPIIDDSRRPSSIAIPFKTRALYSLKSRLSYDILIKYYIEASKCIAASRNSDYEQVEFDQMFSSWLKTKVVPHLTDSDWYVGFSNVLRIQETIEQKGGMLVSAPPVDTEEDSLLAEIEKETQFTKPCYIVIIIILALSILFLCFLYWAVIKFCLMCCGNADLESGKTRHGDMSDRTSLLSANEEYSQPSSAQMESEDSSGRTSSKPQSARGVAEDNRQRLGAGCTGKKFPSCLHKHCH